MKWQRIDPLILGPLFWALVALVDGSPVLAAKDIVIDWEKGEITTETTEPLDEEAAERQEESQSAGGEGDSARVERLRRAVEIQQQVIRRQRARIDELQKENRRLERLLLGYDRLLRQGR